MTRIFRDRYDAGRQLALELARANHQRDALVLALPRGGVPVAYEVARMLDLPLDVLVVRKVGLPGQPELAMGAVASGGARVVNEDVMVQVADAAAVFEKVATLELLELERRELAYRGTRPPLAVAGRQCIVVDDGLATGATMEAAVRALRAMEAEHIVVAVPVASTSARERLEGCADAVVCVREPAYFNSVGQWYEDFAQTEDAEVERLLNASGHVIGARGSPC
jgi:putative phosphoribosyl transferase